MSEVPIYEKNPGEIIVNDQPRKQFNQQGLKELADSMERVGQLEPGVCKLDGDESVHLVIGERRLRACRILGIPFKYYLKTDIADDAMLLEIQIMENLCREDLTWQEEADAKLQLHELRQSQKGVAKPGRRGGQSIQSTADELHESKGLVTEDIELAMWAREIPEVRDAPNKTTAKKIVKRFKEQINYSDALQEQLGEAKEGASEDSYGAEETSEADNRLTLTEKKLLEFDRRCICGKMEDILGETEDETYDIVIFDPPWGVNYDKVMHDRGEHKKFEDDAELFKRDFPLWIQLLYSKMRPDSHLYLFFGIVWHEFVYSVLEKAGFETNRIPLIWHKVGAHRTRNPKQWPGRSYEPIAFARKGSKDLQRMGEPDVISTNQPTPTMKKWHPSAKHPNIYLRLLKRSAFPGDKVLDPMAGSGMFGVACEHLRHVLALDWTMIEMDSEYRDLQLLNLHRGYLDISTSNEPKDEIPDTFEGLIPGTKEWKAYWNANPDQQDAMLAYKSNFSS